MRKTILGYAIYLLFTTEAYGDVDPKYAHFIKQPYSARLQSYNKYVPERGTDSRVLMSKYGTRVEAKGMFTEGEKGIFIQNFENNKSWIMNPNQKTFSLLENEGNQQNEEVDSEIGGIMSTQPCLSFDKSNQIILDSSADNHGMITGWSCSKGELTVKQEFSEKWKLVIKEEWPSGNISLLSDIKAEEFDKSFFSPPESYRKVSLREFYMGAPPLKTYKD